MFSDRNENILFIYLQCIHSPCRKWECCHSGTTISCSLWPGRLGISVFTALVEAPLTFIKLQYRGLGTRFSVVQIWKKFRWLYWVRSSWTAPLSPSNGDKNEWKIFSWWFSSRKENQNLRDIVIFRWKIWLQFQVFSFVQQINTMKAK